MKCSYRIYNHDVYRFEMPVIHASMYVLLHGNAALVIDPSIREEAEQLFHDAQITDCTVLLTHEHFDHISGVNRLRELFNCKVVCTRKCAERISDPRKNSAAHFDALFLNRDGEEQEEIEKEIDAQYSCHADITYTGCMEMQWGDFSFTLTETPGHSPGSQVAEIGKLWYFTGDSLIPGQDVITRLPGGSRQQYDSITRPYLETIAPECVIFPGHGEETLYLAEQMERENRNRGR